VGGEHEGELSPTTGSHRASFRTFNENRRTGAMERFLSPPDDRAVRVAGQHRIGRGGDDGGQ
jgi:hypothetical protein